MRVSVDINTGWHGRPLQHGISFQFDRWSQTPLLFLSSRRRCHRRNVERRPRVTRSTRRCRPLVRTAQRHKTGTHRWGDSVDLGVSLRHELVSQEMDRLSAHLSSHITVGARRKDLRLIHMGATLVQAFQLLIAPRSIGSRLPARHSWEEHQARMRRFRRRALRRQRAPRWSLTGEGQQVSLRGPGHGRGAIERS